MQFSIAQKYLYGSTLLALQVSISEKNVAPALAPAGLPLKSQFLRPNANGRITFSTRLLSISMRPSFR